MLPNVRVCTLKSQIFLYRFFFFFFFCLYTRASNRSGPVEVRPLNLTNAVGIGEIRHGGGEHLWTEQTSCPTHFASSVPVSWVWTLWGFQVLHTMNCIGSNECFIANIAVAEFLTSCCGCVKESLRRSGRYAKSKKSCGCYLLSTFLFYFILFLSWNTWKLANPIVGLITDIALKNSCLSNIPLYIYLYIDR